MQERRLFLRYPWERPVVLRSPGGQSWDAVSTDISVAGIGLRLTRETVTALAQGGTILSPGDHMLVLVPAAVSGTARGLNLQCRVKEVRRQSLDQYVAGAWFENVETDTEAVLARLVEAARRARWG
ncbi:MAG: PilZ domain-containing protein [Chromatiaceae bacterium]|jgi:hypothetical protein|nr:PilZ domain-containing protein [Chromatiaceae bacterium]